MHDFELIKYAKYQYPDTRMIVMSAEDPSAIKNGLDDWGIYGYIRKPFRVEMIYSVLRV
jgi:DNA-binding NarL/FixJ family response regulator